MGQPESKPEQTTQPRTQHDWSFTNIEVLNVPPSTSSTNRVNTPQETKAEIDSIISKLEELDMFEIEYKPKTILGHQAIFIKSGIDSVITYTDISGDHAFRIFPRIDIIPVPQIKRFTKGFLFDNIRSLCSVDHDKYGSLTIMFDPAPRIESPEIEDNKTTLVEPKGAA